MKTKDLYTQDDVRKVRLELIKEQDGKCLITGLPTDTKDFALDHAHDDSQLVRGAVNKHANASLGKLENISKRYLWWYPHSLSTFLRQCADYLDRKPDTRFRHPGWRKKVQTAFNKLNSKQQDQVLINLGSTKGKNPAERKKLFQKALLTRKFSFDTIVNVILNSK